MAVGSSRGSFGCGACCGLLSNPHHQVGLGRFDDQVKVVAQQAIRMDLPASLLTRCPRLQQPPPVRVIRKDRLPPVAPIQHMINRPRRLNAQLPSSEPCLASPRLLAQTKHDTVINPCAHQSVRSFHRAVRGGQPEAPQCREGSLVASPA